MESTREELLNEATTLLIRTAGMLDPVRLRAWEEMHISFPQLRILFHVRFRPGIDVRGVAAALNISPSAASQQVDKLAGRGFVHRSEDPKDRRHVCLELTELGHQAAGEISRSTRSQLGAVLSNLPDDELAELHRLLDKVLALAKAERGRP